MTYTISDTTISDSVFEYNIELTNILNSMIERCLFNGLINDASITGSLTKCLFEKIAGGMLVGEQGSMILDMTIQVDVRPNYANYVQKLENSALLQEISLLAINASTVPRLLETSHKECYINTVQPGNKKTFIVQLATDDTNPRGTIIMFYPGPKDPSVTLESLIPKGYAICDGNNGTPDLKGRFIRMINLNNSTLEWEEWKDYNNEDLMTHQEGDSYHTDDGRRKYIVLQQFHLPAHQHTFNEVTLENTFNASGGTDSYTFTYYYSDITWSSTTIYTGGETSTSISNPTSTSRSLDVTHSHNLNNISIPVRFNFTPLQDFAAELEVYENRPISIEPDAYALIFIMKL